jgi:hypothetical protein
MLCAFEMWSCFWTMIFFFKFKILGISTKLIILCCFSLTTDPATWKNSRHLSKGFLYPFVFGPSFSIMPACVLMYSYRLCAFFSSIFIWLSTSIAGFSGSYYLFWHCIKMQAFLVVNVFYFIFIFILKNMLVKLGLFT